MIYLCGPSLIATTCQLGCSASDPSLSVYHFRRFDIRYQPGSPTRRIPDLPYVVHMFRRFCTAPGIIHRARGFESGSTSSGV